jgi:hypothetical protein
MERIDSFVDGCVLFILGCGVMGRSGFVSFFLWKQVGLFLCDTNTGST